MRTSLIAKAAMGLIVAALVLLAAEGLLRLVAGPPPPPIKVYRVTGDVDQYFDIEESSVSTTFQQTPPVESFPREPEGRRVVVLGGSSVHEAMTRARSEREWPARVGVLLDAEVLNLGEPGLDSFDHVLIVEELARIGVDGVVLYAGHNDLGNALMRDRYGSMWGGVSAVLLSGLEHSQLFCQLRRALDTPEGDGMGGPGSPMGDGGGKGLAPQRRAVASRYFRANVERIAWMLAERQIPLVVVVPTGDLFAAPPPGHCDPVLGCAYEIWSEAQPLLGEHPERAASLLRQARDADLMGLRATSDIQDFLRDLDGRPGVTVVDPERELPQSTQAAVPDSTLFVDPMHLSRKGHSALAAIVAPAVAEVTGIPLRQ